MGGRIRTTRTASGQLRQAATEKKYTVLASGLARLALQVATGLLVLCFVVKAQGQSFPSEPAWPAPQSVPSSWPADAGAPKAQQTPLAVASSKDLVWPEFWGLDLVDAFSDWNGKFLDQKGVLEDPAGGLIVRTYVSEPDGSDLQVWDVDLVHRKRSRAGSKDGGLTGYQTGQLVDDGTTANSQARIIVGQLKFGNQTEPCEDPIRQTYELQNLRAISKAGPSVWGTERRIMFLVEGSNRKEGARIGGYCGDQGYAPVPNLKAFVTTTGGSMFNLQDDTALVQVGNGRGVFGGRSSAVVRLGRDLTTHFQSKYFKVVEAVDYEKLLNERGIFGAQA